MSYIIQQLSIHVCFVTAFALLFRVRQARINLRDGWLGFLLNIGMASLAFAYLQKAFSRMDGNVASAIDVWRESSLLLIIAVKIIISAREGKI